MIDEPDAAAFGARAGRVLLVNDAADILRVTARLLGWMGLQVTTARNGKDAVDIGLLADHSGYGFDLILLNAQLPDISGVNAICLLREGGFQGPIIAICDSEEPGLEQRCLDAGCNELISHAVDFDPVVRCIEHFLPQIVLPSELHRVADQVLHGAENTDLNCVLDPRTNTR